MVAPPGVCGEDSLIQHPRRGRGFYEKIFSWTAEPFSGIERAFELATGGIGIVEHQPIPLDDHHLEWGAAHRRPGGDKTGSHSQRPAW